MHVLIAGAGIGGLCLAHGLRAAGVRVSVFERDPDAGVREQGYRIHIDDTGGDALRRCLPEHLYRTYLATSAVPGAGLVTVARTDLTEVSAVRAGGGEHSAVNRLTLRQILLSGLAGSVHFGHEVRAAEQDAHGVRLVFADGRACRGDVLVGADGVRSAVRPALVPGYRVVDTGLACVYGRTPLTAVPELPGSVLAGFTAVTGDGVTLALAAFRARTPIAEVAGWLTPVADYLMWAVVGAVPDERDSAALHRFAGRAVTGWHPVLRQVVAGAEVAATFRTPIRTSPPVPDWDSGRITLLGDAIHVMPPSGGVGANTALRDAALLADWLTGTDPVAGIGDYDKQMREYATAVVHRSNLAAGLEER